jgi:3-hydroxyacyl-[acyl-carrier-protein] dehydratase
MRWIFLDRITEIVAGERALGTKGTAASEDYFADHFPGFPVVPGVVQLEALAQLSGKLIEVTVYEQERRWVWPIISIIRKAKFRRFVKPGHIIELESELVALREESAITRVRARCEGKPTTDAEMVFVFSPEDLDGVEAQERLERLERENLKILWPDYPAWAEQTRGPLEGAE